MIVHLKNDIVVKNDKGDTIIELMAGMDLNVMNWDYVPNYVLEEHPSFLDKEITKSRNYVVYIKGKFIVIPKEYCEKPLSIGWRYNI